MRFLVGILFLFSLLGSPAFAVEPDEMLKDPKLEQRARDISLNLRCLVCQNQSIDDSNAPLAKDLRILVRERIKKGDSNKGVMQYVVDRYGEYVLLKPSFSMVNWILWFGPFALFLLVGYYLHRNWHTDKELAGIPAPKSLSKKEQKKLDRLLSED